MSEWKTIDAILKRPFDDHEINWKLKTVTAKGKALLLAYMDARGVRDRLDEAFGPHWKTSYAPGPSGGVMCTLSIKWDGEWVSRCGVAENTNIEAVKGGASDALKRAATAYGIGRHLYDLGATFANIQEKADYSVEDGRLVYCKGKGYAVAPSIRREQPELFGSKAKKPKKPKAPAKAKPAPAPEPAPVPVQAEAPKVTQEEMGGRERNLDRLKATFRLHKLTKHDATDLFEGLTSIYNKDGTLERPGIPLSGIKDCSDQMLAIAVRKVQDFKSMDEIAEFIDTYLGARTDFGEK